MPIGANGITYRTNEIVVGNTDLGTLLSIPILRDGSAEEVAEIVDDPAIFGIVGLAVDVRGTIYACVNPQNTVVRIGGIETLADSDDGIDAERPGSEGSPARPERSPHERSCPFCGGFAG